MIKYYLPTEYNGDIVKNRKDDSHNFLYKKVVF